ncbi:MAG: hypothetical protein AAGG08_06065, partial [Actinomycetota bacterium]
LVNLDTDRDAFDGLLIQKDGAGPGGNDPVKVAKFTMWSIVSVNLDEIEVELDLEVAAKDFKRDDITIGAQLRHCNVLGFCQVIGSGEDEVKNADRWKKIEIELGEIDRFVSVGDRFELRIAVLDDSENDAWIAFGTEEFDSHLKLTDDD